MPDHRDLQRSESFPPHSRSRAPWHQVVIGEGGSPLHSGRGQDADQRATEPGGSQGLAWFFFFVGLVDRIATPRLGGHQPMGLRPLTAFTPSRLILDSRL